MKTSKTCPKCRGRKLFHIDRVQQTYCDAAGTLRSFDVTAAYLKTGKKGILGGESTEVVTAGPYEVFVCATCGYAEWYANPFALDTLARLAEKGAVQLVVNESPHGDPFR